MIQVAFISNKASSEAHEIREKINSTPLARVSDEVSLSDGPSAEPKALEAYFQQPMHAPDLFVIHSDKKEVLLGAISSIKESFEDPWLLIVSGVEDSQFMIELVRKGMREFLATPVTQKDLEAAFQRFLKEGGREILEAGKIFTVTSAKGGMGLTTTAINLATSISALPGTRVALLDFMSALGGTAAYLNIKPEYNLSDAISAGSRLDRVLLESYMSWIDDVAVLSGPNEYYPEQDFDLEGIRHTLETASEAFSHVVIDLPRTFDEKRLRLFLHSSDKVLIVLTPEVPAIWHTHRLVNFLRRTDDFQKIKIVLNRSQKSDEITKKDVEKALKVPVAWCLPNDYRAVLQSMNSGQPLVCSNHSHLARSFYEMACEVTGIQVSEQKKKGFLNLF